MSKPPCTEKYLAFKKQPAHSRGSPAYPRAVSPADKHEEVGEQAWRSSLTTQRGRVLATLDLRGMRPEGTGCPSPAHRVGVHPEGKAAQVLKATVAALVGDDD